MAMTLDEVPEDVRKSVQLVASLVALTQKFAEKYGPEAYQVLDDYSTRLGEQLGATLKREKGIQGTDLKAAEAITKALIEFLGPPPDEVEYKIEGNKFIFIGNRLGVCPNYLASKVLGAKRIADCCDHVGLPRYHGVLKNINPNIKLARNVVPQERSCYYEYELMEEQ